MRGKIIRGVGGFYYVDVPGSGIYECRARGIFRKEGMKPLVGDNVSISVTDETDMEGSVEEIEPRRNELFRPSAANIDQVLVVFALQDPAPNFNILDRFLIIMQRRSIPVLICFNKQDLVEEQEAERICGVYRKCGYETICCSVTEKQGLELLCSRLIGKTTCVAGPSGAGKSSLTNYLMQEEAMEVGALSRKIARGRQTTRHTQLVKFAPESYFLDTPGFTSLQLPDMEADSLRLFYPEFLPYENRCRFQGCMHLKEPDCGVKEALESGEISKIRYENYAYLVSELKNRRRY